MEEPELILKLKQMRRRIDDILNHVGDPQSESELFEWLEDELTDLINELEN